MAITTIDNLWKFVKILPYLPDTFRNSDVAEIEEYPLNNEQAISRTLSYVKYLGLLNEERKKEEIDGKKQNIQLFHLTAVGRVLCKTAVGN